MRQLLALNVYATYLYFSLIRAGFRTPLQDAFRPSIWHHRNAQITGGLRLNARSSKGKRRVLHIFKHTTKWLDEIEKSKESSHMSAEIRNKTVA